MPLNRITPFLAFWRSTTALDREVVDAVVVPEHQSPSPGLQAALDAWPGTYYWSEREGPNRLVLIRTLRAGPPERWWLHISLFFVTFLTVWMAGAYLMDPSLAFRVPGTLSPGAIGGAIRDWVAASRPGLGFAAALMAILLVHEMGHYVAARRYQINASPPFFLPAPHPLNFIGTFGAFIRLRSPIIDRRQLLDVGAAGPWAGLVVSLVALVLGLVNSQVLAGVHGASHQLIYLNRVPFFLGDSLVMDIARSLIVGEGTVLLHPLALAGWFGIFITMLNLLPLGQLDGGHIVYALIGRHQAKVGLLMWYGLILLGFVYGFYGWWLWAALILILGRGRIAHPSVLDPHRPIPPNRWSVGVATAVLFALTFSADPLPSIL